VIVADNHIVIDNHGEGVAIIFDENVIVATH
jgi:hypothetical protein